MVYQSCNMVFKVILQECFHQLHSKGDFFICLCLRVNELYNITASLFHMGIPCMYHHHVSNVTPCPIDIHIICANQPLQHVLYLHGHQTYFFDYTIFLKELDIIPKLLQSQIYFVFHFNYHFGQLLALGVCMACPTKMIAILATKLYIIRPIHQFSSWIYNGWALLI